MREAVGWHTHSYADDWRVHDKLEFGLVNVLLKVEGKTK
jgi:hypothetical protein